MARHAYNWANAIIQKCWDEKQKVPSAIDLHKRLVTEVKAANQWCYETNKNVPQKALVNVRQAWARCFKKVSQQPRFKKKGQRDSFYLV
ncbi:transposase [Nostoc sp.]|uniref:transposase n=1 Tax=Nostoc sp. TaxID=1180 RepID=UPI002FFAEE53